MSTRIRVEEDGWKLITDKRPRKRKFPVPPDKILKICWQGFDQSGNQKYFVETKDGSLIPLKT